MVASLGGLLYGADIGIIAAALLYLGKTVELTLEQTSLIVAAVLGGSMVSSLAAGVLADWFGRKTMMIVSGLMFVASVGIIVLSQGFVPLFLGRLLQGMSGGVIAVVVPLYLAECLSAKSRGRGTAIFQFFLTFGIVMASAIGLYFTRQAESAIAASCGESRRHPCRGQPCVAQYVSAGGLSGPTVLRGLVFSERDSAMAGAQRQNGGGPQRAAPFGVAG